MWQIRPTKEKLDPYEVYADHPNLITIKWHHDGVFTPTKPRRYVNGLLDYIDLVDTDLFSVLQLSEMLLKLGYGEHDLIWYHFRKPLNDLDMGLHALGNDDDVRFFLTHFPRFKEVDIYTEHGRTTVNTYEESPQSIKVMLEELPSDVLVVGRNRRLRPAVNRPLLLEWGQGEPSGLATQGTRVTTEGDNVESNMNVGEAGYEENNNEGDNVEGNLYMGETVEENQNESEECEVNSNHVEEVQMDSRGDSLGSSDSEFQIEKEVVEDAEVDMTNYRNIVDHSTSDEEGVGSEVDLDVDPMDFAEFESGSSSEIEPARKKEMKKLRKQKKHYKERGIVSFYVGKCYGSKEEVKRDVTLHGVETRRELAIVKNDKKRIRVVCNGSIPKHRKESFVPGSYSQSGPGECSKRVNVQSTKSGPMAQGCDSGPSSKLKRKKVGRANNEGCPWVLHISTSVEDDTWIVKTYKDTHKCIQRRLLTMCTQSFLADQLSSTLMPNPNMPVEAVQDHLSKKFEIELSLHKAYRAKQLSLAKIRGSYVGQYKKLRDYILELQRSNEDTTAKLDVFGGDPNSNTRRFKRIYICFGALKKGFKACKREILGLDGAFMKGPFPGQVLTAVGVDPNNGIYPLAFAIVEAETSES